MRIAAALAHRPDLATWQDVFDVAAGSTVLTRPSQHPQLEGRVDDSTPVGQLLRLARMADRLGVRTTFAERALARPGLPPEVEEELRGLFSR